MMADRGISFMVFNRKERTEILILFIFEKNVNAEMVSGAKKKTNDPP